MTEALATAGVLLAAGRGRRMGRVKQLLPWGQSTVVAHAFDALARWCGAGMVIVLGADADRIVGALGDRSYDLVEGDSDAEQFDSACRGLRRGLELPGARRILLHPADHPVIPRPVVEGLLARAAETSRVLLPTYRGRGGHPVLISADVAASIISWDPNETRPESGGLRAYWQSHGGEVERIEFPHAPDLVMKLNTPEDYAAAQGRLGPV
ncbi:MAG: nucleotidyltransferase family protein [Planctomycetota bacterium]|jgi:molybdenum cofactor cytidylyltransferase